MVYPFVNDITLKYPSGEDEIKYLWSYSIMLRDLMLYLCTWLIHTGRV